MPELSQNNEILNKQISFVSHEIRNNISICDMYVQIIRRRLQNEKMYNDAFSQALNCIEDSLHLINVNLADLKALKNSEKHICNAQNIILTAIQMGKAYVGDKCVEFITDVSQSADIFADENKLLSCFINIIKNAIEAIDNNGTITVSLFLADNNAVIRFSNNGIPVPDDIKEKIFNYGYTTKDFGSGYGLCLTKQYLESQNASLELIKSDDKETTFEITIPVIS